MLHLQKVLKVAADRSGTDGSLGAGDFFTFALGSLIPSIAASLVFGLVGAVLFTALWR